MPTPVTIARGSSSPLVRVRSIARMVSSLGRGNRCTSRPARTPFISDRVCSMTSEADAAVGGLSASAQRPSRSMRIGTAS